MPAEPEPDPNKERRAKPRYQTGVEPRLEHFDKGTTDHEDSADIAERAIRLWESMPPHKR